MNWFFIAFIVVAVAYIMVSLPGWGKFWHRHNWYAHLTMTTPSMYSRKKQNIHTIYKCSRDCSAYKIYTRTEKIGDQTVQT